jgi:hypothetical protein
MNYLEEGILNEAGLSRVLSHAKNPFAVLTSFRDKYTLKQNRDRNKKLEGDLRSIRAGGIKLIGHWEEAPDGMDWKEAKKLGKVEDIVEESYFIPKPKDVSVEEFRENILKLVKKYDQDAAVFGDGKMVYLLFPDNSDMKLGPKLTADKMGQAWSKVRRGSGRKVPFVFEGTINPSNNFHRMALQRRGVKWFTD